MITKVMMTSNSSEWETPQAFFEQYKKEFRFALDVYAFPATREGRLVKINRQCLDEWLRSRALRRAGFPQFTVCGKV